MEKQSKEYRKLLQKFKNEYCKNIDWEDIKDTFQRRGLKSVDCRKVFSTTDKERLSVFIEITLNNNDEVETNMVYTTLERHMQSKTSSRESSIKNESDEDDHGNQASARSISQVQVEKNKNEYHDRNYQESSRHEITRINELGVKQDATNKRVNQLEQSLKRMQLELDRTKKEKTASKRKLDKALSAIETKLEEITKLRIDKHNLEEKLASTKAERDTSRQSHAEALGKIQTLERDLIERNKALNEVEAKVREMEKKQSKICILS